MGALDPGVLVRDQPFASVLRIERVDAAGSFAHSGTACFVSAADGRRFKLRRCRSPRRAREIERLLGALPGICPEVIARRGRLLLLEALDDHRGLEREELLARLADVGAMVARTHEATGRRGLPGPGARALASLRSRFQRARDLRLVRGARALDAPTWRALVAKLRSHGRRFGLPVAVELDDLHKANLMLRESDGDLRYVDEEGVAVRPLGTSLASLVKTADREEHWRAFREGYGGVREPAWITPEYTEYVVILDTVRKVANKLRGSERLDPERLDKLPAEIADLERVALRAAPSLEWQFHRG